jgi:4a-hydroxytetrahydrobiopterin dehydratase
MSWIETQGTLTREIQTHDFLESFRIVSALVAPSEALGHHPDLAFGWGFVRISLTTHDAGGVTELDRQLALRLDEALGSLGVDCHAGVTKPL